MNLVLLLPCLISLENYIFNLNSLDVEIRDNNL